MIVLNYSSMQVITSIMLYALSITNTKYLTLTGSTTKFIEYLGEQFDFFHVRLDQTAAPVYLWFECIIKPSVVFCFDTFRRVFCASFNREIWNSNMLIINFPFVYHHLSSPSSYITVCQIMLSGANVLFFLRKFHLYTYVYR